MELWKGVYVSSVEEDEEKVPYNTHFTSVPGVNSTASEILISKLADVSFSHSILHSHANGYSLSHHEVLFNEKAKPSEFESMYMSSAYSISTLMHYADSIVAWLRQHRPNE